jgi:hypothetical protein
MIYSLPQEFINQVLIQSPYMVLGNNPNGDRMDVERRRYVVNVGNFTQAEVDDMMERLRDRFQRNRAVAPIGQNYFIPNYG